VFLAAFSCAASARGTYLSDTLYFSEDSMTSLAGGDGCRVDGASTEPGTYARETTREAPEVPN